MSDSGKTLDDTVGDEFAQSTDVKQESEVVGVARVLNQDETNKAGLSNIDMNTRLEDVQVSGISRSEELADLGVIPSVRGFTKKIKRHNVSLDGKGRGEIVQVANGLQQQKQGGGFMDRLTGLFKPKMPQ